MLIRKADVPVQSSTPEQDAKMGAFKSLRYSEAGGLKQFGAYVEVLMPGAKSSDRHWHEQEDEFLYLLSGEAVLVENDGEHLMQPGDAACWPAGVANAHHVLNRSSEPCSFLIVGTRPHYDIVHYPDSDQRLHHEKTTWRLVKGDGIFIKGGNV
jgi:uncharacterized cupin superfamily protein